MGEAVITRGGLGGGNVDISNDTKQLLGLNNNSTLDDCLSIIARKDPNMATMTVTVINPDGTPAMGTSVRMVPVSGVNLEYVTNSKGQVLFKSNAGQVNFVEMNNNIPFIDLEANSINNYAAVVGEVYRLNLVRKGKTSSVKISKNQNVIFSGAINSVDVHCYGSGGGGGGGFSHGGMVWVYESNGIISSAPGGYYGGAGGSGYYNKKTINPTPFLNYDIKIYNGGSGGAGGSMSTTNFYMVEQTGVYGRNVADSGYGMNGSSGGTVLFSNIISATGGSGGNGSRGSTNGVGGSGGNGGSGGAGGGYSNGYIYDRTYDSRDKEWCYDGYLYVKGKGGSQGSSGYVILNNFTYK